MSYNEGLLQINGAQPSDSGNYTCVVQNMAGEQRRAVWVIVSGASNWPCNIYKNNNFIYTLDSEVNICSVVFTGTISIQWIDKYSNNDWS